jgi:hypothetical protein
MDIDDVTPTREELLEELVSEFVGGTIPDNSITVKDMVSATGLSLTACLRRLNEKVADGSLGVVKVRGSNYYYKIGAKK